MPKHLYSRIINVEIRLCNKEGYHGEAEAPGGRGAGDHAGGVGRRGAGAVHLHPREAEGEPGLGPAGGDHQPEPAGGQGVSGLREAGAEQLVPSPGGGGGLQGRRGPEPAGPALRQQRPPPHRRPGGRRPAEPGGSGGAAGLSGPFGGGVRWRTCCRR